jgi:hypothetical protein
VAEEPTPAGLGGAEASAWAQLQRLGVDAMKWRASKLRPKAWGDLLTVDVAVQQRISTTATLDAAQRQVEVIDVEPRLNDPSSLRTAAC